MGKGSKRRTESQELIDANWDKVFKRPAEEPGKAQEPPKPAGEASTPPA